MSKRNNQVSKTAARERLRLERERQAKRDKVKRQLVVAGSVVAALAIAGGIGYAVVQNNKPDHWEAAKSDKVVAPAHTTGKDGTTVVIGESSAKKTLKVYEDLRCPICAQFEQVVGPSVKKDIDDGKFNLQFVGGTFIDTNTRGEGSRTALSALGAALNVSPEAFLDYKGALYSAKWHPEETEDTFKDTAYLIKVADTVPALKKNASFQKDVKNGTYDAWAMAMSKAFDTNKDDVTGTPSLVMDGKKVTAPGSQNAPMSVDEYTAAIDAALKA
ncbi:thioredoxin domain-containing protein [Streptomyces nodosus]|uniref:DSBA oxidoreductase n=1 Tax=Streptomyces nodosus TaxID=40318 RepID=A0A0B5DIL0_9ACTN|nr:thioredoxin domain-containing protein [Streptomyces nodosus]AJE40266.1 DSBA oxidoreductase [Streptomyces nodosus]MBB4791290.1 protein-disulfide isomerase [Streptomyces nodosus]QEV38845.1 DsbA family protein [Streptomyces nodosus]